MKVLHISLTVLFLSAAHAGVFSFVDMDPTPPELFRSCLSDVRDIYGFGECTSNAELVDTQALKECNESGECKRAAYPVPFFPEKLGLQLEDTYDELWDRYVDDVTDYAHDAWAEVGCFNGAYGVVAAKVALYAHGDASLRYWSEVSVASSYYLPAALWWRFPFPGLGDTSDDDSDRIIVPSFSLLPKPNQYARLASTTENGIYYFQRPAFPDQNIPFGADEVQPGLPGLMSKELRKGAWKTASVLEYSQFGHGSFFEVYGKRNFLNLFKVVVETCVPSPATWPVMGFAVPKLPQAYTRWTTSAEGYPLSNVGEKPWAPDPTAAYTPNTLEEAADRVLINKKAPFLIGLDPSELDAFDLDPRFSLAAFLQLRIPAKDRGIPEEVIDDAKGGGEGLGGGLVDAARGGFSLGDLLGERESLADVLNCPPVTVGPAGAQTYPIVHLDETGVTRTLNLNEAIQYLFRDSADHLYDGATKAAIQTFQGAYTLPRATYPDTWQTTSGGGFGFGLGEITSKLPVESLPLFGGSGSGGVLCLGDEGSEVAALDRLLARAEGGGGPSMGGQIDVGAGVGVQGSVDAQGNVDVGVTGLDISGVSILGNRFTEETEQRLRTFQARMGLEPDGVTGPETWAALHAAAGDQPDPDSYVSVVAGLPPGQPWPSAAPPPAPPATDPNAPPGGEPPPGNPDANTTPEAGGETTQPEQGQPGQGGEPAPPPPDSQELAGEVLAASAITLLNGEEVTELERRKLLDADLNLSPEEERELLAAVDLTDGSDPLSNIRAAASGEPAKRTQFGGVPSGETWLNPEMLEGLLDIAEFHDIEVSVIAGGVHPAGSPHYGGAAFKISAIDGVPISEMETALGTEGGAALAVDEEGNQVEMPSSLNGERIEEILAPGEDGSIDSIFERETNNPLVRVMALCELGGAVSVSSPLTDARADGLQCAWPTAEQ